MTHICGLFFKKSVSLFMIVTLGVFNKRGFLYGPLCPMYGFAAIMMIQMLKNVKTNTLGKFAICMISILFHVML